MPKPLTYNWDIYQGQTFNLSMLLQDSSKPPQNIDLAGYSAQMMMRENVDDSAPIVTWDTATGELVIDAPNSKLAYNLSGTQTQALPAEDEVVTWYYDILLDNGTFAQRIMQGVVVVHPAVTRPAGT